MIGFILANTSVAGCRPLASCQRLAVQTTTNNNSVPAEWQLGRREAAGLIDLTCQRAEFVVDTLAAELVPDPELPGMRQ